MPLFGAATSWLFAGTSLLWFLSSAKMHGRSIRLERELEGHYSVDFRGPNHPWVESLWKRDRIQYWTAVPIVAIFLVAGDLLLESTAWSSINAVGGRLWHNLILAVVWSMSIAFLANGATSWIRLERALNSQEALGTGRQQMARDRPGWVSGAEKGSFAWWGLSLILFAAAAILGHA